MRGLKWRPLNMFIPFPKAQLWNGELSAVGSVFLPSISAFTPLKGGNEVDEDALFSDDG